MARIDDEAVMPAEELVKRGYIDDPGYADILSPGEKWRQEIDAMLSSRRIERALEELKKLNSEDVATILEALHGRS